MPRAANAASAGAPQTSASAPRATVTGRSDSGPHADSEGMAALVRALGSAADRRGLADRDAWRATGSALSVWTADGDPADGDPAGGSADARAVVGQAGDPGTGPDIALDAALDAGPDIALDAALDRIAAVFGLSPMATDVLLVAAAPDIDPNIAVAYGLLLDADGPRAATVALALELAGIPVTSAAGRVALSPVGPLRRWGLVHLAEAPHVLARSVTVGEDVAGALLGASVTGSAVTDMAIASTGPEDVEEARGVAELSAALTAGHRLCWVENPPGGPNIAVARTAFAQADLRCVAADLALADTALAPKDAAIRLVRWAGLNHSGLVLGSAEALATHEHGHAAVRVLAEAPIPVVMVGSCRWNASWLDTLPITVRTAPLAPSQRLALWRKHIDAADVPDGALVAYRLTPEQIDSAARHAIAQADLAGVCPSPALVADAVQMLGGRAGSSSPGGSQRFSGSRTSFDDLEVPAETRSSLDRLVSWVRLRDTVTARGDIHGLGGKGTGIAALFTGNPGTGKTLAAHVIADTAGLDLMQVDLSGVVDKYIGETEKNLERVFADAEGLNVVLFFDEADALFGKRSEVRDAHDRFANQEVSYLLQRMEKFNGITVLATNLKGNLDAAFARRMHFIVHFPDPDEPTRRRLWARLLSHAGGPDPDDPVDIDRLAAAMDLAGGDLRNIVLAASYDAAIDGSGVGMRHVVAAAIREHAKLGRRAPPGL